MAKQNCILTPSTVQDTPTLYHKGHNITHPNFDLENGFCYRLNQMRGIAGLFSVALQDGSRGLDENECNGINNEQWQRDREKWKATDIL